MTATGPAIGLEKTTDDAQSRGAEVAATLACVVYLVPALARALGPGNEVVVHDLRKLPNSIVAIEGDVTDRTVGGPITDLALRQLRADTVENVYHYRTTLPDGRAIRSSTIFLKDSADVPIGCLCINSDLTTWLEAERLLRGFLGEPPSNWTVAQRLPLDGNGEMFVSTVDELVSAMIRSALETVGVPPMLMQKQHKLAAVRDLDTRGFFLIRDAVDIAARALRVTRYTIYNYLNEIRDASSAPS